MNVSTAKAIIGSIGFPSKMPGTSYALPASACIAGARLAKQAGTICSECYALSGKAGYQQPRAMIGQSRRLAAITNPAWVEGMVWLLTHLHAQKAIKVDLGIVGIRLQKTTGLRASRYRYNEPGFHRWHDSGDLQSIEHLEKIIEVCRRTPQIKHWLPTRETAMLRAFRLPIPENLIIRVSATMINGAVLGDWLCGSTVHEGEPPLGSYECPAPKQSRMCGDCRACWSREVPLVSYEKH